MLEDYIHIFDFDKIKSKADPFHHRNNAVGNVSNVLPLRFCHASSMNENGFLNKCASMDTCIIGENLEYQTCIVELLGWKVIQYMFDNHSKWVKIGEVNVKMAAKGLNYLMVKKGRNSAGTIFYYGDWKDENEAYDDYIKNQKGCFDQGLILKRLAPVPILARELLSQHSFKSMIPTAKKGEISEFDMNMAFQSRKVSRFECMYLGNCGTVNDYDMNWAYCHTLEDVPSFHPLEFDKKYGRTYLPEALEAFLFCEVHMTKGFSLGALTLRVSGGPRGYKNIYPLINFRGYFTKGDVDLIRKYGLGKVDILDGVWYIPKGSKITYPYKGCVKTLRGLKENPDTKILAKDMSTPIWGIIDQSRFPGAFSNFLHTSCLIGRIRTKIIEISIQNMEKLISISVDGYTTFEEATGNFNVSTKTGDMKHNTLNEYTVLSELYRDHFGKNPDWIPKENGVELPERRASLEYVLGNDQNIKSIGKSLGKDIVSYIPTKRPFNKKVTLNDLKKGAIELSPIVKESEINEVMNKDGNLPDWFPRED